MEKKKKRSAVQYSFNTRTTIYCHKWVSMAEMPTSGDMKKGDSLFFHNPPPPEFQRTTPRKFDLYQKPPALPFIQK